MKLTLELYERQGGSSGYGVRLCGCCGLSSPCVYDPLDVRLPSAGIAASSVLVEILDGRGAVVASSGLDSNASHSPFVPVDGHAKLVRSVLAMSTAQLKRWYETEERYGDEDHESPIVRTATVRVRWTGGAVVRSAELQAPIALARTDVPVVQVRGNDGASPVMSLTETADGVRVTVRNPDGTEETALVPKGRDGSDGDDGEPGPEADVPDPVAPSMTAATGDYADARETWVLHEGVIGRLSAVNRRIDGLADLLGEGLDGGSVLETLESLKQSIDGKVDVEEGMGLVPLVNVGTEDSPNLQPVSAKAVESLQRFSDAHGAFGDMASRANVSESDLSDEFSAVVKTLKTDVAGLKSGVSGLNGKVPDGYMGYLQKLIGDSVDEPLVDPAVLRQLVQDGRVKPALDGKVDKVTGKGLSTHDLTDAVLARIDVACRPGDQTISSIETRLSTHQRLLETKVTAVEGKQLSTYDFTAEYKRRVDEAYANLTGDLASAVPVVIQGANGQNYTLNVNMDGKLVLKSTIWPRAGGTFPYEPTEDFSKYIRYTTDSEGGQTALTLGSRVSGEAAGPNSLVVGAGGASGPNSAAIGGSNVAKGDCALASGNYSRADGAYATAMGWRALAARERSFVWSGEDGEHTNADMGAGTFSIYPQGGLAGVFIAGRSLQHIIAGGGTGVDLSSKRDRTDNIAAESSPPFSGWKFHCEVPEIQAALDASPPVLRRSDVDDGSGMYHTWIFDALPEVDGFTIAKQSSDELYDENATSIHNSVCYMASDGRQVAVTATREKTGYTVAGEPYVTPTGVRAIVSETGGSAVDAIPKYEFVIGSLKQEEDSYFVTLEPYHCTVLNGEDLTWPYFKVEAGGGSGRVRDFMLVVDLTGMEDPPTITWPDNFRPRTDAETDFKCEAGVKNVYWISEYAPNEFCVAGWQETDGGNAQ